MDVGWKCVPKIYGYFGQVMILHTKSEFITLPVSFEYGTLVFSIKYCQIHLENSQLQNKDGTALVLLQVIIIFYYLFEVLNEWDSKLW